MEKKKLSEENVRFNNEALITGTLLLMLVLYVMMYITRNIEVLKEE